MSEILDNGGRPIRLASIERGAVELASPSEISRWSESVATGLNPERLARILRDNDDADTLDMLTLASEMEERDLHYFSQVQTRVNAVSGAPRRVEAGDAKPTAGGLRRKGSSTGEEIAEAWKTCVVETPEFQWMIDDLMDAVTKSYSVIQPIWDTSTRPWTFKGFEHHDPRCFMWEREYKKELRIRVEGNLEGKPIPAGAFIVHFPRIRTGVKLRGGLARLAAINYLFKTHTVKDWLAFAEVYGMPIRIGRYDPHTATDEEKRMMRHALVNLGHDAAMMIPKGMDIEIEDARRPTSGDNIFNPLVEYFDEQTSKAINGITSGSDAKAKGIGTGEGDLHRETRQDIKSADALALESTIRYVARIWTEFNYGVGAPVPKTCIDVKPPEDKAAKATTLKTIAEAINELKAAGKRIPNELIEDEYGVLLEDIPVEELDAEAAREQLKRPAPEPGEPAGKPGKPKPGARTAANAAEPESLEFAEDEASSLLANWEELLTPHRDALAEIAREAGGYDEFMAKLKALAEDVNSDPLVRAMAVAAMKARGVASAN